MVSSNLSRNDVSLKTGVSISVGKDTVTIKLQGAKKFLAIKSELIIPLENIKNV
jgi:hypothetical protein